MTKQFSKVMMVAGFILCSLLSVSSFAQENKHNPEERAKMMTDKMKSGVNLTDDQYEKVYALNVKYATKMQELKKQSGTREEKKEAFKSLRNEQKKELSTILTIEQLSTYSELQKQQRKEKNGHHQQKRVKK